VTVRGWVPTHLGARLDDVGGRPVESLVELALRRNARRAHLLVSPVLGKHVPADPELVYETAAALGRLVAESVDTRAAVMGFAETATALGHVVAETMRAPYLHSTRRLVTGCGASVTFEEEHSHARAHRLLPEDPELLSSAETVVVVDDEISTGRTAVNTISELHRRQHHRRYVIASIVDVRSPQEQHRLQSFAESIDTHVDVVSLATARLSLPTTFLDAAGQVATAHLSGRTEFTGTEATTTRCWPAGVREGARHGFLPAYYDDVHTAANSCGRQVATLVEGDDVLVLGCEELMYAPLLIARELARALGPARRVQFSSTTRSPIVTIDEPGYPVRSQLTFDAHDDTDTSEPRFAYNVAPHSGRGAYTDIVLVVDDVADTPQMHGPRGVLAALSTVCRRVHLVVVPTYRPVPAMAAAAQPVASIVTSE
jgi:adenine/guanine phosphoribosyltransferase-like PRPP-binding protein